MKGITIIKNRSDLGAGTRGSDMGIDAIEIAAINQQSDYFSRFPYIDLETENEAIYYKQHNVFAKRIHNVRNVCVRLAHAVAGYLKEEEFPLVISGDHSSALGTISGIRMAHPDKKLGVIWIDAHADMHAPYTTPSGNLHGMPLAGALAFDNPKRHVQEIAPDTAATWEEMKNIGGFSPKVYPQDVLFFGVRDTEEPEDYAIAHLGMRNYRVDEIRYRGMQTCMTEAMAYIKDCDHVYISFDIDSLDCDMYSHGTGTPVPYGFDTSEVIAIIKAIIAAKPIACMEIVEVNPTLDNKGNRMAEAAFEVLAAVTEDIIGQFEPADLMAN
ncbi:MAG: arginase [Bacteroidota bacterium]